jgi:hypothetical protein
MRYRAALHSEEQNNTLTTHSGQHISVKCFKYLQAANFLNMPPGSATGARPVTSLVGLRIAHPAKFHYPNTPHNFIENN